MGSWRSSNWGMGIFFLWQGALPQSCSFLVGERRTDVVIERCSLPKYFHIPGSNDIVPDGLLMSTLGEEVENAGPLKIKEDEGGGGTSGGRS